MRDTVEGLQVVDTVDGMQEMGYTVFDRLLEGTELDLPGELHLKKKKPSYLLLFTHITSAILIYVYMS